MVDEPIHDDSSYYEISITAGQAFLAVVLLIASLAAAFAFGIVVGEARGNSTLASRTRPPVILESEGSERGRIEELGVNDDPFPERESEEPAPAEPVIEEPELIDDPGPGDATGIPSDGPQLSVPGPSPAPSDPGEAVPHVAQILSTTEQDAAERLAARLIEAGFSNSYVERVPAGAGMLYRVRVRFASESEARAAVDRLKRFAPGEIWISRAER